MNYILECLCNIYTQYSDILKLISLKLNFYLLNPTSEVLYYSSSFLQMTTSFFKYLWSKIVKLFLSLIFHTLHLTHQWTLSKFPFKKIQNLIIPNHLHYFYPSQVIISFPLNYCNNLIWSSVFTRVPLQTVLLNPF